MGSRTRGLPRPVPRSTRITKPPAMNIEHLAQMVNDIANYFAAEPDHAVGVNSVADHLRKFWDPVMRRQIIEHLDAGGEGLEPMAKEAVRELARQQAATAG